MSKINEYPQATAINNNDLFVIDQQSGGDHATKSASVSQIAEKATAEVKEDIGNMSALTTTDKSSLVGAVNELTTYIPVWNNTASGAIATFDTSLALPLQDCTIAINAVQERGTPSPSSPKAISGFTGANVVNCSDNLVTGMTTSTADGITTSYDNTTGLISIENNSRTTNYATGSSRNAVASNLDTSHTYKYKFIPEITGVIATDAAGVGLPLNEEFTGVASVKLRVTSAYDFVSTHPIGDITTTRLVIVDVTEGGKITTHPVSWNDEAGTVYGGSLDVTTGKLTVVNGSMGAGEYQLTPIPINQLSGTNNIFCDTGNTSVMFACSLKDYIDSQ